MLVTLGDREEAPGQVWHESPAEALTGRQFIELAFAEAGTPPKIGDKKAKVAAAGLRSASEKAKDLRYLGELAEAATRKPTVERSYAMIRVAEAHRHVETGRKKGTIVINMDHPKEIAA